MRTKWRTVTLGAILDSIRPGVSFAVDGMPEGGELLGMLTLAAVAGGRFNPAALKPIPTAQRERLGPSVEANTLLMSRSNTQELVGAVAFVPRSYKRLFLPDLLWELRVNASGPDPRWVAAYLSSEHARQELISRASGTSGSMKKLSISRVKSVPVVVLPKALECQILRYLEEPLLA